MVKECVTPDDETSSGVKLKLAMLTKAVHKCSMLNKNTIIFASSDECISEIKDLLVKKLSYRPEFVSVILDHTNQIRIDEIEKKWEEHNSNDAYCLELKLKGYMTNLILICTENGAKFMNINNAEAIINFQFPG